MYYYSKKNYDSFTKFSDELTKANIEQNPYYKDQKQLFIYILNILAFFYSSIAEKTKDKDNFENYSTLSTSLVNQAEKIVSSDPMTLVCKGFLFFTQGDYDNSDMIFTSVSDYSGNLPKNIVILAKLGLALNAYNQINYQKAISFFVCLIKQYDYYNENILESLGICYYYNNQIKKAKEIFEKVLEYYPNNYKIKTYLSIIELKDIENEEFEKYFQKIINSYESNNYSDYSIPALLISLCNILLISGKYNEAEEFCKKLNAQLEFGEIKYNSNNNNTINNYNTSNNKIDKNRKDYSEIKSAIFTINAKYLLCIGKKDEAFSFFLRGVQANPRNIEAQFGLGQIYLYTQNLIDAERCFELCKTILDENKKVSFKVLKYLAYILSKTKRKEIDKIISMYKTAINTKNDDIDCYVELAELLNLKSPNESLMYYKEAVRLINLHKKNKDKKLAIENDSSTLYSEKILPEILNNISCILLRLDRIDEVESYLTQAKNLVKKELSVKHSEETNIRLHALKLGIDFNFALYYEKKAMFDYTHFLCKKIIQENPYFIEAYIKLSELAKMRGNKTKANEYIKLAIEKNFIEEKEKKEENNNVENDKKESNLTKIKKILTIMNKPINPLIIQAYLFYESGKELEAIQALNQILKQFDDRDPYTLIFLGNIYYSLAIDTRGKGDKEKLNKAVELYFHALELDKYNSMAAVGLCNCLAEYNYVDKSLEIYKTITETLEDNHNAFVNESLLYMNEKKYEKASIILNKVLKKIFNNRNPTIENLLAKCYIEIKEFKKANRIIKNLMMRYPDNIGYKYNYGILLIAKSDEILLKTERKVVETKESIKYIEKGIKLFETISIMRREDREEKIIKAREFIYKCSEMLNLCKLNLSTANDRLKQDIEREKEMNQKIQSSIMEYNKILEAEIANKNKKEDNNEVNIELFEKNKEIAENLAKMVVIDPKLQKKKKKDKDDKKSKDDLIDDNELDEDGKNDSDDENRSFNEKKHKHKRKHKHRHKHKHHHKHRRSSDDQSQNSSNIEDGNDNGEKDEMQFDDDIKVKKKKKLKKKNKFKDLEQNLEQNDDEIQNNENNQQEQVEIKQEVIEDHQEQENNQEEIVVQIENELENNDDKPNEPQQSPKIVETNEEVKKEENI